MKLIILGSGGYGRTIYDIAEQLGFNPITVLDDSNSERPLDSFEKYISDDTLFIPAFGNNAFRLEWMDKIENAGGRLATLIHQSSYVSPKTVIESGTVVLPKAVINTGTVVGRGSIINIGAIVDHDCVLGKGVHIAPGAIVKGENKIQDLSKIESGEVVDRGVMR
ncbi:MAG: hypothetical protein K6G88_01925 [Lachnospiraceae bacterium]|nr:hypothetical protein [Lachnospiraceae bacterium]